MMASHEVRRGVEGGLNLAAELASDYQHRLERFARKLKPRFEAGEFRGLTEEDMEDESGAMLPIWKLTRACVQYFGLKVTVMRGPRGEDRYRGDSAMAHRILAVSPFAEATVNNWNHVAAWAAEAVTWDVLILARARRWYTPGPTEVLRPDAGAKN